MPISFACPGCRQTLQVSDAAAGRSGKCPHCKGPIVVPHASVPAASFTAAPPPAVLAYAAPTAAPEGYSGAAPKNAILGHIDALLKKHSPWSYVAAGGASLLVLLLFLFVLISLFSGSSGPGKVARYFPDRTNVVMSLNMDDILSSPIYRDLKKEFPEIAEVERQATPAGEIGINDISKVWFAFNAEAADRDGGVAVISLKRSTNIVFDTKLYRTNFKTGNYTIYQAADHQACQGDGSTMVVGFGGGNRSAILKTVLDRGKAADLPEGILAVQKQADFSRSFAVAASVKDVSKQFKQQGAGLVNTETAESVEGMVAEISLGSSDLTVSGRILCKDAKNAEDIRKAAEGLIAMGKLMLSGPEVPKEVHDVLGAIKWNQSGNQVTFGVKITKDQIMQLARSAKATRPRW